uniref:Uncharacterized protein n=1 Tax=Arundo donax TaxID=35708 RepID=A0A0A9A4H0_ARUDO
MHGLVVIYSDTLQQLRMHWHAGGNCCSVQLPERGAHGSGGEQDGLLRLRRRQRTEQRQQRVDQRHAHGPRHALLHLQHPRALHHRHEARRHRRLALGAPRRHADQRRGSRPDGSGDWPRRRRGSDQSRAALMDHASNLRLQGRDSSASGPFWLFV